MPSVPMASMFSARTSADGIEAEENDLAFEIAAELADIFVIGVEERGAGGGRASISSYFARAMPAMNRSISRCTGATLVTRPCSGLAMLGEGGNFASVVHPHFDDGKIVFRFEREQAEGNPK